MHEETIAVEELGDHVVLANPLKTRLISQHIVDCFGSKMRSDQIMSDVD